MEKKIFPAFLLRVFVFVLILATLGSIKIVGASEKKVYHDLIYQNVYGPTSRISAPMGAAGWARMVEEETKGRVTFKIFHGASLVPGKEALGALQMGTLDVLCGNTSMYSGIVPEADMWHLPFFFNSQSACYEVMFETEAGPLLREAYAKKGVVWLCPFPMTTQSAMTRAGKPIKRLSDFKGLKMRASGGISNKMLEAFGSSAISLHGSEIYTALQRGTIDGMMYPEYTLKDYKFEEVVKNIMRPSLVNPIHSDIFMRKSLFDEMPEELQMAIWSATKKFVRSMEEYAKEVSEDSEKFIRENNINVYELPKDDLNEATRICQEIWELEYASKSPEARRIYQILMEYRKSKGN